MKSFAVLLLHLLLPIITAGTTADHRCGKDVNNTACPGDACCSTAGYCGRGPEYCAVPSNCQQRFGRCDSDALPRHWSPHTLNHTLSRQAADMSPLTRCVEDHTIALTFDDGPSGNTAPLLDVLKVHKAKATFFVAGNTNGFGQIDKNHDRSQLIKRMHHEGHQVASHTWSHFDLDSISPAKRREEMLKTDRAIGNLIKVLPRYMRAPYVRCSAATGCLDDMKNLGYQVVEWQVDSGD